MTVSHPPLDANAPGILFIFLSAFAPLREAMPFTAALREHASQVVNDAIDAGPDVGGTEINQKSQFFIGKAKIGQQLFEVEREDCFDGFQFDDNLILDNHIDPEAFFANEVVVDG